MLPLPVVTQYRLGLISKKFGESKKFAPLAVGRALGDGQWPLIFARRRRERLQGRFGEPGNCMGHFRQAGNRALPTFRYPTLHAARPPQKKGEEPDPKRLAEIAGRRFPMKERDRQSRRETDV
jgi:hypothetical protein